MDDSNTHDLHVELAKAGTAKATRVQEAVGLDTAPEPEGQLTIDVYQTPTEIVIESAVAGVDPSDIDIDVSPDSVTIRGERQRKKEVKDEDYFYQECYWGRFSRSVILPQEIDPDNATVEFENGVLAIHLPKTTKKQVRKLKVKTN